MQVRKTCAIGVDGEHRAFARTAASIRSPIEGVAREDQSGLRISSVVPASEIIQIRKTRAIGVDSEHGALIRTAASKGRSIQGVAR